MINKPKYYLDKMASNTDVFTEETSDKAGFTFTASSDDSFGLNKMIEVGVYKDFEEEFIRLEHEKRQGSFMIIGKDNWDNDKREGDLYAFVCMMKKKDSGTMTYIFKDFWNNREKITDIITMLSRGIYVKSIDGIDIDVLNKALDMKKKNGTFLPNQRCIYMSRMSYISQLITDENYEQLQIEVGKKYAKKFIKAHNKILKRNDKRI